jgi:carbon monoxide dehydrogenase subunit G
MVNITKSREMHSNMDRIWDIMSKTDDDQKYWTAIRDVKVIGTNGNTIEREASVGPSGFSHRSRQALVLDPKKSIKLKMTGDAMTGERTIVLVPLGKNSTRVDVEWNFELKNVPGFVQSFVKKQISKVTDKALTKIAADAEASESTKGGNLSS